MTVLEECATNEPNGVEISIPVKKGNNFTQKAEEFFSYWDKGTVLLNGHQPDCIYENSSLIKVNSDTYTVQAQSYNPRHVVVMGNVPYPLPIEVRDTFAEYTQIIKRVPIGALDFTPNREELQQTPAPRKQLHR